MSESKSRQLPPVYQIGICLVLIVLLRLYYAWIESQTYWLYPRFADSAWLLSAIYLGLVPIVSLLTAIAAYRYFSPTLTIPFAVAGGGAAGLIVNSIPGALIGAGIGLIVCSRLLRGWLATAAGIFVRFDIPALLWGAWLGSLATCLFVRTNDQATTIRIGLIVFFLAGLATLLYVAYRTYRAHRGKLFQAMVGCVIASGLGLVIGPMANTLYRIYALQQVGDVLWDPMPRFNRFRNGIWETYSVALDGESTDAHLRLLQGLPAVTSLYVRDADVSDHAFADMLGSLPKLELLQVRDISIGDKGLEPLKGAGSLTHVRLTGTSISDQTFANLAAVPTLQTLDVDGVTLRGQGLRTLARSGRLRYLVIANAPLTDDDLAGLNGLQGLTTLKLKGTEITGSGLKHLSKLPSLVNLTLVDSPIQDHSLTDLNPNALWWLTLEGIPLSDEGATAIGSMTSLRGLSIRRADLTDTQLRILSSLPPTTHLVLDGRNLTPSATEQLVSEDVAIHVDGAEIKVDDVDRLIAIGYDVQLTDCQFDEASIQRLANHKTDPHFVIRVREFDQQMAQQLSGGSVHVVQYWQE